MLLHVWLNLRALRQERGAGTMPKKKTVQPAWLRKANSPLSRAFSNYGTKEQRSEFDASTCLPSSMSKDDIRGFSEVLDRSMEIPFGGSKTLSTPAVEWEVQSKEDIIKEVKQHVQALRPWRPEFDEAAFERRREEERQERIDRGFLIILPDNRVRTMDTLLSRRVRAQLLGEEEVPEVARLPPPARREEKTKKLKARTPWYLPPETWFNPNAAKGRREGSSGSFPYDSHAYHGGGDGGGPEDNPDGPQRLTQREKETLQIVEAYKQHMKGSRLPHFLL
mmetsp:Transcript_129321/g.374484  ORF Transcript_129321/g.374484 Transcript_129321/m.374484 type:complete len:279 (+) Transcript_129321:1-837(+)